MATRWACVGPGRIATDFFHAIRENLSAEDHEFVAVGSSDLSRAQSFAEKFQFKRAYGSYGELANDQEVEVVYISTLHINHKDMAILMLEAGKHVLCEKPMTMNLAEAKLVFKTARESKKLFVEGNWTRFFPAYDQIRKELSEGTLGDIRLLQANFGVDLLAWQPSCDPKIGCGGMAAIGCYLTVFATMVFNEMPESIQAKGFLSDVTGKGPIDLNGSILLQYRSGATACLSYEITAMGPSSAVIVGTKGFIEIPFALSAPEKIITPSGTYEYPLKKGDYIYLNTAGLHYEATAVRQAILTGTTEIETCSWRDSEISMAIIDEVQRQIGMTHTND